MKRKLDLRGDLQAEVMAAVWKLGQAKVEDVRAQPSARRSDCTTIQTVMGRLVERGLLTRERAGTRSSTAFATGGRLRLAGGQ